MADTKRKNRFGSGNGGDLSAAVRQNTETQSRAALQNGTLPVHHYATMHFDEKKKQKKTQNPELPKGLSFGEYLKLGTKDAKELPCTFHTVPDTFRQYPERLLSL